MPFFSSIATFCFPLRVVNALFNSAWTQKVLSDRTHVPHCFVSYVARITNNTLTTPGARRPCHLAMRATGVPTQAPSRYPLYFFTLMLGLRYPGCMQNLFGMPCHRKWPSSRPTPHTHEPGYQVVDYFLVGQHGSDVSRSVLLRTVTLFHGKRRNAIVRTNKDFGRMATSQPPYRHV